MKKIIFKIKKATLTFKSVVACALLFTSVNINAQCSANFTYTVGANGVVNFSSSSSGTTISTAHFWNFGGMNILGGPNMTHSFTSSNTQTACLTIISNTTSPNSCTSTVCYTLTPTSTSTACTPTVNYSLLKDSLVNLTWYAFPVYPSNVTNATWSWGDGSSTVGLYPSHTYSAAGTYSTCVTISVSCGTTTATYCINANIYKSSENNAMINLQVKPQLTPTSIKNAKNSNLGLTIYPNPSNGQVNLKLENSTSKEFKVVVYNLVGEMVHTSLKNASSPQVDLSALVDGSYFVEVTSDNSKTVKKLVISK